MLQRIYSFFEVKNNHQKDQTHTRALKMLPTIRRRHTNFSATLTTATTTTTKATGPQLYGWREMPEIIDILQENSTSKACSVPRTERRWLRYAASLRTMVRVRAVREIPSHAEAFGLTRSCVYVCMTNAC